MSWRWEIHDKHLETTSAIIRRKEVDACHSGPTESLTLLLRSQRESAASLFSLLFWWLTLKLQLTEKTC